MEAKKEDRESTQEAAQLFTHGSEKTVFLKAIKFSV